MTEDLNVVEVESLSYEQAIAELDKIINQLDTGQIDIDSLQKNFRRAVDIAEEIDKRITRAKNEVEAILPRISGFSDKISSPSDPSTESAFE